MTDLIEELDALINKHWSDQRLAVALCRARDDVRRSYAINERLDRIETLLKRNGS